MSVPTRRGRLVVLEGVDGSGKSTQAVGLAEHLGAHYTREPGGTRLGEALRDLVLDPANTEFDARAEALVIAAARAQHVAELIEPLLAAGHDVVCERFVASSLAYQGAGRGLGVEAVAAVNRFATDGLVPDLVVLLDLPDAEAEARVGHDRDRLEAQGSEFRQRVRDTYRSLAAADPGGWALVDARGDIDQVAERVRRVVAERLS
jgi:dTMP kinase